MEIDTTSYRLPQNVLKNLVYNHFMSINLEVNFFADHASESLEASLARCPCYIENIEGKVTN